MLKKKNKEAVKDFNELSMDELIIDENVENKEVRGTEVKKAKKQKKKRISKKKIFTSILILSLLALIVVLVCFFFKKEVKEVTLVTTEPESVVEKYSFSFIGVGDALLHPGVYMDAATNKKGSDGYTVYDFHHMFTHVKEAIKDYDLKYYNQETVIGGKSRGLKGYPSFNSPDEIGLDMMDIGFNVVSLATNHTLDQGKAGATYSANFWHTKDGVLAVGSYRSAEERNTPVIKEINGIKYSVLNYTYGTNGIAVPSGASYLVNLWSTEDGNSSYQAYKTQVKKDVEAVRDKADVVIVAMHWGTEYQLGSYNTYQKDAAEYLSSLGVDVIVGTHPHVVQPVEFVNDTLVIYSLGNFISGQTDLMKKIGGIAAFTINKTVKDGTSKIEINDVKADLLYTYHQNYKNYSIMPFNKMNDSLLYNYRSIYEKYKGYLNPKGDSRIKVGFIE